MASSSDDDDLTLTINKDYATNYSKWRQKEELSKLKQQYGDVSSASDSSSESEDENAEGLTVQQEKDWLRTLAALKSKDPKIYDKEFTFYHSEDEESANAKAKSRKEKPMTIKDYERKVALEKGGILSDESDSDEDSKFHPPGYYEEQEEIRKSFKEAIEHVESDSDDEFLQERRKTKEELEKEENEYLEWLKGQKTELVDETTTELVPLKEYWNNPALDSSEKYLRDFILNKPYLDEDDEKIPTYEDIVHEEHLSEDEEEVEKQEDFENKYNFRFEQPDQDFIKAYPRTIQETVRRKENKRAERRRQVKERKQKAKEQKTHDLKRLKNLKKMEIMDKLDTLRHITGNQNVGFSEKDLEGDFDPAEYDAMMKKAFSEDYYDMEEDDAKPEWKEAEQFGLEVDEDWDHWEGAGTSAGTSAGAGEDQEEEEYYEPHCEDPDFIMDADYDPTQTNRSGGVEGSSKKKKRKRSKFSQALETQKPVFNPEEKSFEEYFDEYYKLDFEDIVGDMPCRFKYRKVVPNDFGLDAEEVLAAEDKHLNAWVSLKKMSQYRTEEEEQVDIRKYKYKAKNAQKKLNIIPSLEEGWGKDTEQTQAKKRKKKKKQKSEPNDEESGEEHGLKRKWEDSADSAEMEINQTTGDSDNVKISSDHAGIHNPETSKNKKIRKGNSALFATAEKTAVKEVEPVNTSELTQPEKSKKKKKELNLSDARLKAYGINPKKFKYTQQTKSTTADNDGNVNLETSLHSEGSETTGKKKKRKKNKSDLAATAGNAASEYVDICDTAKAQKPKHTKKKQKLSDDRLKAYGINPKKFKYTQHAKADT